LRIYFARNIAKLAKNNKGIISNHQYGRAHATCVTPVLNKLLTVQLLIQKRTEGIVFDNDAKGCYDRITSGLVVASLRRLVYSKESVKMLGLLWAQVEHHVCTGFGVSDKAYGSTTEKLLYGIGQGSCASPILWALINQLLLAPLGEKFTCIRLVVIDGEEEHIRPSDSFVDDTTTGTTNDESDLEPVSHVISDLTSSEETLIAKIKEIIKKIPRPTSGHRRRLCPQKRRVVSHQPSLEGRKAKTSPKTQQPSRHQNRFKIDQHRIRSQAGGPNLRTPYFGILYDRRRDMHCP
jgi:hypothetical protein